MAPAVSTLLQALLSKGLTPIKDRGDRSSKSASLYQWKNGDKKVLKMNERLRAIVSRLRRELEDIYEEKLVNIVLFGSQARGDARPDSDIDILIILKSPFDYRDESERVSFPVSDLCLEYNVVIACAFTTLEELQQRNSGFFRNVRREGIAV